MHDYTNFNRRLMTLNSHLSYRLFFEEGQSAIQYP